MSILADELRAEENRLRVIALEALADVVAEMEAGNLPKPDLDCEVHEEWREMAGWFAVRMQEALRMRTTVKHPADIFIHTHESNGKDDLCAACGLDIRNSIHKRKVTSANK